MTLPNELHPGFFSAAGGEDGQSLRFKGNAQANVLHRTQEATTINDDKNFTFATWFKLTDLGETCIFGFHGGSGQSENWILRWQITNNTFDTRFSTSVTAYDTSATFRDTSAWYHLLLQCTNGALDLYVNGTKTDTQIASSFHSSGFDRPIVIGAETTSGDTAMEGYLAETYFVQGSQLHPVNDGFIRQNSDGVFVPDTPTISSYGSNGFHLTYDSTQANGIGHDSSGENHHLTSSGFDTADVRVYSKDLYSMTTGSGNWSTTTSKNWSSNTPPTGFNGNLSNAVQVTTGDTWVWRPSYPLTATLVEVYPTNSSPNQKLYFNGTEVGGSYTGSAWNTVYTGSATTVNHIGGEFTGGGNGFYGIRVNGTVLVDNTDNDVDYLDTPTSNYALLNILNKTISGTASVGYANLRITATASGHIGAHSTVAASEFDCYCEATIIAKDLLGIGVGYADAVIATGTGSYIVWRESGDVIRYPGNVDIETVASYDVGDTIGMTITSTQVAFYKNGTLQGTYSHSLTGDFYAIGMAYHNGSTATMDFNFGQMPFIYTVPTGFKALQTNNLPEPTIKDGSDHFQTIIVTPGIEWTSYFAGGSGSTDGLGTHTYQTSFTPSTASGNHDIIFKLSQRVTSVTFDFSQALNTSFWYPGWMVVDDIETATSWINKAAISTDANGVITITDSNPFQYVKLRSLNGSSGTLTLESVTPGTDSILTTAQAAFPNGLWWIKDRVNSNQHQFVDSVRGSNLTLTCPTLGGDQAYSAPSGSSVAWCWNYDSSNPSVNGFEIITYTGNATVGKTVSHNLGKAPEFIITKERANGGNYWCCYHVGGGVGYSYLNDPLAYQHSSSSPAMFTAVSSTNWTYDANGQVNGNGVNYVSYAWTSVPGYSAFGKYTGNGDPNGPFIYTGMKVAWVLIKGTNSNNWHMRDTTRHPENPNDNLIYATLVDPESSASSFSIDMLSNGFKIRGNHSLLNTLGQEYLYSCFAENPFGGKNTPPVTAR